MKIKKHVKSLVILTAFVAVLGIASVSFAAWSGSGFGTATANAYSGNIQFAGFDAEDQSASFGGKIVPYDQGTVSGENKKVVVVTLPSFTVSGNYKITVSLPQGSPWASKIYLAEGEKTDADIVKDGNINGEIFKSVSAFAIDGKFTSTETDPTSTVSDRKISLILDSSSNADMNQTISLTVTLVAA